MNPKTKIPYWASNSPRFPLGREKGQLPCLWQTLFHPPDRAILIWSKSFSFFLFFFSSPYDSKNMVELSLPASPLPGWRAHLAYKPHPEWRSFFNQERTGAGGTFFITQYQSPAHFYSNICTLTSEHFHTTIHIYGLGSITDVTLFMN